MECGLTPRWSARVEDEVPSPSRRRRRFGSEGVNLTRFTYALADANASVVEGALATVAEHHPGEIIWVQHVARPRDGGTAAR
jgi:hypothetical protein